jgi:hypothetical protein
MLLLGNIFYCKEIALISAVSRIKYDRECDENFIETYTDLLGKWVNLTTFSSSFYNDIFKKKTVTVFCRQFQ